MLVSAAMVSEMWLCVVCASYIAVSASAVAIAVSQLSPYWFQFWIILILTPFALLTICSIADFRIRNAKKSRDRFLSAYGNGCYIPGDFANRTGFAGECVRAKFPDSAPIGDAKIDA